MNSDQLGMNFLALVLSFLICNCRDDTNPDDYQRLYVYS